MERAESVKGRLEVGRQGLPWGRLRHVFKRLESPWKRIGASWHAQGAFQAGMKRLEPFWGVLG